VVGMVTLRLFAEGELGYFESLPGADQDPFSFYGHHGGSGPLRARYAENKFITDSGGMLAIDLGGTVIGDVEWRAVPYGPPGRSDAFNIGIWLLPERHGRGYGTTAQIALARYLFDTYPVNRIEAATDLTNLAEQRSLEKSGFTREGVLRGAQWRAGQWNDLVVFAVLRSDL
jgi:RimJ/RimL family protein N-acetyltransferase